MSLPNESQREMLEDATSLASDPYDSKDFKL